LWKAAERGVRIRLLLDDNTTSGLDRMLAVLSLHPNIEIRLFNPYVNRGFRLGDITTDFGRINRRMHNKSFNADNQVAILGGRNIGNEYFSAGAATEFIDLDAALIGPSVHQVARQFDLYWNCESAYPAMRFITPADAQDKAQVLAQWTRLAQSGEAQAYLDELRDTPLMKQMLAHSLPLEWTTARVLYDDPEKVQHPGDRADTHLLPRLIAAMGKPQRELELVSPYFVPGREGTQALIGFARCGVRVRVLTNALAATDVAAVHAGYRKYREALLRGGVVLYELKPGMVPEHSLHERGRASQGHPYGSGGSSAASLHAKTFALDRERVFIGSFNFDPRSSRLNTEMGVVLDSPAMAVRLSDVFDTRVPQDAYQVRLDADGHGLEWLERSGDALRVYHSEPETGWFRRMWIHLLSILPIEELL
jgi:putative cardiolipin synthase